VTEKSGNRPQGVPERLILDLIGPFVVHFLQWHRKNSRTSLSGSPR